MSILAPLDIYLKGKNIFSTRCKNKGVKIMKSEINESLIQETVNLGNQILTELDNSLDTIRETERKLDESIFFHKSAKRILRGMTWTGYFMNLFYPVPKLEPENPEAEYISFEQLDRDGNSGIDNLVKQSKNMNSLLKIQNKELERVEMKIEENERVAERNLNVIFKYNNS